MIATIVTFIICVITFIICVVTFILIDKRESTFNSIVEDMYKEQKRHNKVMEEFTYKSKR